MFKNDGVADEIYRSMEKTLVSNQTETKYGFSKLATAVDYLHAAANIFEKAGMYNEALEVTKVLQELIK